MNNGPGFAIHDLILLECQFMTMKMHSWRPQWKHWKMRTGDDLWANLFYCIIWSGWLL